MVIIGLLLVLLVARLAAVRDHVRKQRLLFVLFLTTIAQAVCLLILYQETLQIPEYLGTTGSDSLNYLTAAKNVLLGTDTAWSALHDPAGGYTIFCYAILVTSPTALQSPLLMLVANLVLFCIILVHIEEVMHHSRFTDRASWMALTLLALNGALAWTSIRVLKDVLFYTLFLEIFMTITRPGRFHPASLVKVGAACVAMAYVREHSYVLSLAVSILGRVLTRERPSEPAPPSPRRFRAIAAAVAIGLVVVAGAVVAFREAILNAVTEAVATHLVLMGGLMTDGVGADLLTKPLYIQLPLGLVRFFLLPIPVAMLTTDTEFPIYRVLLSAGTSINFFAMVYSFPSLLRLRKSIASGLGGPVALLAMAFAMSLTYVFLYFGAAEARHRFPFMVAFGVLAAQEWARGGIPRRWHVLAGGGFLALNAVHFLM